MVDAASRSDENESTTNYDYDDSVVDGMVSLHWLKIMVAAARAPLRAPDRPENTMQGRRLPRPRRLYNFDTRLNWNVFMEKFHNRAEFKRHIRMSAGSFNKLTNLIRHALEVDNDMANLRGGPIIPEICLYCCLRYIAGGSYSDIRFFTGISTASLYRLVWKVVFAINDCDALAIVFPTSPEECEEAAQGFSGISKEGCISNCVAVLDGYHLEIRTPPKQQVGNVRSFFSGHYQTHGVNVQAACDHNCRFLFLGVAGPGVMGDRDAVKMVTLNRLIESMPPLFCAIGDCAYTPTEHLVPIYRGADAQRPKYDNFNFFASQLRIRIEMEFGLMVKKWGILSRPLSIKMSRVKHLMVTIARLHNFCIDERLADSSTSRGTVAHFTPANVAFDQHMASLRDTAADEEFREMELAYENPWSNNRERMVSIIESLQLTRPRSNIITNISGMEYYHL